MGTLMWIEVPGGGSDWWKIGGGDTKSRELCGPGVSGESKVNVGLTQGSALSPLLFIAVVELISRKICIKVILQKLLYAGGLAGREWGSKSPITVGRVKDIFSRHGLRVRLVKTEVI